MGQHGLARPPTELPTVDARAGTTACNLASAFIWAWKTLAHSGICGGHMGGNDHLGHVSVCASVLAS